MPLTTTGKNFLLDALDVTHVSLHTADPGQTGASEVAGGTYARQSVTWNAAAAGNLDSSNTPVFDVPAATTITHAAYWTALTGGSIRAYSAIVNEAFTAAGQYTLDDADIDLNAV